MKRTPLILLLVAVLLFCTCGDRTVQHMLDRAETVMNENPSEAIAVLDSIGDDGLSRSQRMRRLLLLTNAENKCDTVFRSDSIQRLLVDYYESHGSANERMLAHYLLGRAYYDMGEVPAALESFQDAASCADTVSSDCDYQLLSRIHGQTARLFLEQEAPDNAIQEIDKIAKYAMLVKDTAMWLVNEGQRANAYYMLGNEDSLLFIYKKIHDEWRIIGNDAYASMAQVPAVVILLDRGEVMKAGMMLAEYESKSGAVNANYDVAKGNEIFYYIKGRYYAEAGKTDSAFMFYRKALSTCTKADEKAAICYHLASLYEKAGNKDSVFLYWRKSYNELDSAHVKMGTERLQRLKAMYDYNRHLKLAEAKSREAQATRSLVWIISLFCLSIILSLYIVILRHKKREEEMVRREENLYKRLVELEDSHKEKERFKRTIEQEQRILNSTIAKHFRDLAQKPAKLPSSTDWKSMLDMISRELPSFQALLCDNQLNLRQEEMNICMLIRLRFKPKEICNLTGLSSQNVTNIRKRLLYKIYGDESGGSKDFDQRIMKIQ